MPQPLDRESFSGRSRSLREPETCENMGVGWIDWRSWGDTKLDRIRGTLIPDAKAKGYWWGKN